MNRSVELSEEAITELEEYIEIIRKENKILREQLEKYKALSKYIEDQLKKANPGISVNQINKLISLFWEQVKEYKFNPWETASWIFQESEFKITAISHKGAIGITQIMPKTGEQVAGWLGIKWESSKILLDPEINLRIGFYHLAWGRKNSVNRHQTFSMYFWGYGNVKRKGLVETVYSKQIFERAASLEGLQSA